MLIFLFQKYISVNFIRKTKELRQAQLADMQLCYQLRLSYSRVLYVRDQQVLQVCIVVSMMGIEWPIRTGAMLKFYKAILFLIPRDLYCLHMSCIIEIGRIMVLEIWRFQKRWLCSSCQVLQLYIPDELLEVKGLPLYYLLVAEVRSRARPQ